MPIQKNANNSESREAGIARIQNLITAYKAEDTTATEKRKIENALYDAFLNAGHKMARKYTRDPKKLDTLFAHAMVGLSIAIKKYDPQRPNVPAFFTFAHFEMRNELIGAQLKRLGISQGHEKHLFYNYGKYRAEIVAKHPNIKEEEIDSLIAEKLFRARSSSGNAYVSSLEAAVNTVESYKAKWAAQNAASLNNRQFSGHDRDGDQEWLDALEDDSAQDIEKSIADTQDVTMLRDVFKCSSEKLNDREQSILWARLGINPEDFSEQPERTLESISQEHSVSRERIRQIFESARKKIRLKMLEEFKHRKNVDPFNLDLIKASSASQKGKRPETISDSHKKPEELAL
ncbi:MAG: sigma-70 family RNA polymerase sigma factor [Alphaproteobacteria bacterium]